ncbi:60S ribosomal protein L27 [Galemys pyrenaicus]|uniref:60S ribosomal protein L27 n=1 Tax=Galemys pyrenaicus TaxID=202257 RepID=A0A8J6AB42_GALPY|nr:60S ribosomal protein L27 [Galemys pyrenaicus]
MGKCMNPGQVALVSAGRYSGRKAVPVENPDDGAADRPNSTLWWLGLIAVPQSDSCHGQEENCQRSTIKSFAKVCNYNHRMPTAPLWVSLGQNCCQRGCLQRCCS